MRLNLENKVGAGFGVALTLIVVIGVVSCRNIARLTADAGWVRRTEEIQTGLTALLSTVIDAETGARGFTITGDERFLEPYQSAVTNAEARFRELRVRTADNPGQQQRLDTLSPLLTARLKNADDVIELRRAQGFTAAQGEIATDRGRQIHESIRAVIAEMQREERARTTTGFTQATIVAGGLMAFLFLGAALLFIRRDFTARRQVEALRWSEERLRLFVEHSPAAIAVFDRDMRYRVVSHRWLSDYRMGGRKIIGCSHYEIFPDVPARWKEIHRRCLAGAVEKCEEDPFPRADGTLDWVRWEIHPWHDAKGGIGGIILFSEVITARKRAASIIACQAQVLEMIAMGAPLTETLDTMLRHMEALAPGMPARSCCSMRNASVFNWVPRRACRTRVRAARRPSGARRSSSRTSPPILSGRTIANWLSRTGCAPAGPHPSLIRSTMCWARSRSTTASLPGPPRCIASASNWAGASHPSPSAGCGPGRLCARARSGCGPSSRPNRSA